MISTESKEQIRASKEKQKSIVIECDKAIADIQSNISVLQKALADQKAVKQQAEKNMTSLNADFPDVIEIPRGV